MSELCIYQVEDIVWNDFLWSDDHMVMHPGAGQADAQPAPCDSLKKRFRQITNEFNGHRDIVAAEDIDHEAENGEYLSLGKRRKTLGEDSEGSTPLEKYENEICILDDLANIVFNNSLSCTFDYIASPLDDLEFFKNIDSRHPCDSGYDLPEMGKFEDADRMFRNCHSAFRVEAGGENEMGWCSTLCHTVGHGDPEKVGLKSPYPDSNAVDSIKENHSSSKCCSMAGSPSVNVSISNDDSSWTGSPDSTSLVEGSSMKDPLDGIFPKEQIDARTFPYFMNQRLEDPSGPSTWNWTYAAEMDPTKSAGESENCELNPLSQMHSPPASNQLHTMKGTHDRLYKHADLSKGQYENRAEKLGAEQGRLPEQVSSSNIIEASTMTPEVKDASLESSSFHQLQLVMGKLGVRARRNIRDSLCRLAHSAEQRNNEATLSGHLSDDTDTSVSFLTKGPNSCKNIGKDTNPIDRSVAALLFRRPSEPSLNRSD